MISKGNTHSDGAKLADYMERSKPGERAETWELRGFASTNLKDAFRAVDAMAGATKCEQPFMHVQVRNREGEVLTRQQWEYTADRIERMLGLPGQPRAITFHTYEHNDDQHMHVAWSRIDQETMKAKPLPFFKDRLKKTSRELELHFGLEPVTSRREGHIQYAPKRAEDEQARRLGLDIHEVRNAIRACWDHSDCGRSFQGALEHEGMILAQGEKRDFVIIDREGGIHALGKRIVDMTASKIRDRLSDISRDELPTVDMARTFIEETKLEQLEREKPQHNILEFLQAEMQEVNRLIYGTPSLEDLKREVEAIDHLIAETEARKREQEHGPLWDRDYDDRLWQDAVIKAAIEKEEIEQAFVEPEKRKEKAGSRERELGKTEGEIRIAWSLTDTGQAFADAIEDRGMILAVMSKADAEKYNGWERQRQREKNVAAVARGEKPEPERDRYRVGELVVINSFGSISQLTYASTVGSRREILVRLEEIDRSALLSVTAAQSVMKDVQAERRQEIQEQKREAWRHKINESRSPLEPEFEKERSTFREAASAATQDERVQHLHGPAAQVWAAWRRHDQEDAINSLVSGTPISFRTPGREAFAEELDAKGISFATVSKEEADRSYREHSFAREVGRHAPRFKEGEIVLITEPGPEYRRKGEIVVPDRVHKIDQTLAEKFVKHLGTGNELQSIGTTLQSSSLRAVKRAADREAERMEWATDIRDFSREISKHNIKGKIEIGTSAFRSIAKTLDSLSNAFDSLLSPKLTPAQIVDGLKAADRREAEADNTIDFARYTSENAQHRQQREQELEEDRQRQRERGGRDR